MTQSDGDIEDVLLPPVPYSISASRIHAWMFCSRSHDLKYNMGLPGITGYQARIGVKMHDRIAQALENGGQPKLPKVWNAYYQDFLKQLNLSDNLLIEKKLIGTAQGKDILGYLDLIDLDNAFILDWKTGKVKGYPVQAYIYTMMVDQLIGEPLPFYYGFIKFGKLVKVKPEDLEKGRKLFQKFVNRDDKYLPCFDGSKNKCLKCSYRIACAAVCSGL